jgi:hypothetical protein
MPPDEYRSEGTPSLGEGPDVRGERFFCLLFLRRLLKKVSRRQGETASRRYRGNGYVLNHLHKPGRPEGRQGQTIKPTLCEPETKRHKGLAKTKASTP